MGCVQTKGKVDANEALDNKTLLASRQRRKGEEKAETRKHERLPLKLDDTLGESSLSKNSMTYDTDVRIQNPSGEDFNVTMYPLPPTAIFPRSDAVILPWADHAASNINLVKPNVPEFPSSTVESSNSTIEMESEPKCVEKVFNPEALHSPISAPARAQTVSSDSYVIPASVHSSLSASTTFTFAPVQSSPLESKLPVVTEEHEGAKDDLASMKHMGAIPETPEALVVLERTLLSVADASENLWNRTHATCNGSDGVVDESKFACKSVRTRKLRRASACC